MKDWEDDNEGQGGALRFNDRSLPNFKEHGRPFYPRILLDLNIVIFCILFISLPYTESKKAGPRYLHEMEETLYCIDGAAKCQAAIDPSSFIKLFIQQIKCKLGLGNSSTFKGIGVQIISIPDYPNTFVILSPA